MRVSICYVKESERNEEAPLGANKCFCLHPGDITLFVPNGIKVFIRNHVIIRGDFNDEIMSPTNTLKVHLRFIKQERRRLYGTVLAAWSSSRKLHTVH